MPSTQLKQSRHTVVFIINIYHVVESVLPAVRVEAGRPIAVVHSDREERATVSDVDRQFLRELPPAETANQFVDVLPVPHGKFVHAMLDAVGVDSAKVEHPGGIFHAEELAYMFNGGLLCVCQTLRAKH